MNSSMTWRVELEHKTTFFYSGDTPEVASRLYELIFNVKPISIIADDGTPPKTAPNGVKRKCFTLEQPYKVIIAGGRDIDNFSHVKKAIQESNFNIGEVVSGVAKGVDTMGEFYANSNDIAIKQFPAKWKKYGKRAGHLRNAEMAEYADALILVWDGESKGSANMLQLATKKQLQVHQLIV